jgi:hypothetical protein
VASWLSCGKDMRMAAAIIQRWLPQPKCNSNLPAHNPELIADHNWAYSSSHKTAVVGAMRDEVIVKLSELLTEFADLNVDLAARYRQLLDAKFGPAATSCSSTTARKTREPSVTIAAAIGADGTANPTKTLAAMSLKTSGLCSRSFIETLRGDNAWQTLSRLAEP